MGHRHSIARPGPIDGFDVIAGYGNRPGIDPIAGRVAGRLGHNWIVCKDGFTVSVIAGYGTYCLPRPSFTASMDFPDTLGIFGNVPFGYSGPYRAFELGMPSARPEPWEPWSQFCDGDDWQDAVFGYVPGPLVRGLLNQHGGFWKFDKPIIPEETVGRQR